MPQGRGCFEAKWLDHETLKAALVRSTDLFLTLGLDEGWLCFLKILLFFLHIPSWASIALE
jgi:hypothetical protein